MAVGSWARNCGLVWGDKSKLLDKATSVVGGGKREEKGAKKRKSEEEHKAEVRVGKKKAAVEEIDLSDD
jgi:hypothetical protein